MLKYKIPQIVTLIPKTPSDCYGLIQKNFEPISYRKSIKEKTPKNH